MVVLVRSASTTAVLANPADCATCREISLVEACNCSVAAATVWPLAEAWSEATDTALACMLVSSAVADMLPAVACISVDAALSVSNASRIWASKTEMCPSMTC